MRKPSVLIVDNCLHGMGAGARSAGEELALQLANHGWHAIATSSFRSRLLRLSGMILTIWRRRTGYDVAVVNVFSGYAFIWAEVAVRLLRCIGKPCVLALHGGNLPAFCSRNPRRARRLFEFAAAVVAPSRYLATALRDYRDNVRVLPNGLNLAAYCDVPRGPVEPRLVWIRAFHSIYQPRVAVETLARLRAGYPSVELTMIGRDKGDGSLQSTRRLAIDAHVEAAVHFTGGLDQREIPSRIQCGDIFLNTSTIDNMPVSVIEALASGLCVVSTNVGGIPFLLEHERTALLVPPRDPDAMAAAVRRLLEDPVLAARLSRNGRAAAVESDWSRVLPQWIALLAHCAASPANSALALAPKGRPA
ncbi:MAG: glycosyltransferase family 4 protein [Chloroflexi bacterium]|nr:glycosyltransferase family 4 protein [Chloroflexota bacterium]